MEISIAEKELYSLIKKAVREVLQEETLDFFLKNIPSVSEAEMEDIVSLYDRPPSVNEVAFTETIEILNKNY